ncbi:hypothetical protein CAFE_38520 [Caprobacter fermentans]|uniref:Uncharacterized protein n=1 Tax=Caproicibacter fermentans TaxID=2576756 RepID=A0A6N8I5R2_9FIRM|nr:hypothetical protein [Caproicibacter fermentans]MVB13097.1 hypothetical protein [Caproicibacter fermentans]QNK40035.1 hypothetical protein HCR03_15200 [Caproicibacter fermentans]
MTVEEMKRMDRRILTVQDPFGSGLPVVRRIFEEVAVKKQVAVTDVVRQYMNWKWSKS